MRPRHRTSATVARTALLLLEFDGRFETAESRSSIVVLEQVPASLVASDGSVFVEWPTARHDELIANALMVPFKVIVPGEFADRMAQLPFAQRHNSVQAFGSERKDKSFGVGIEVWAPRRQSKCLHTTILENPSEVRGVQWIAVEVVLATKFVRRGITVKHNDDSC